MQGKNDFCNNLDFKTIALISYSLGVSLSLMGPVFHYVGWMVSIASLFYGWFKYRSKPELKIDKQGCQILFVFLLYTLWSAIAYAFNSTSLSEWARYSSVPIEFLGGMLIAILILDNQEKRNTFLKIFVAVASAVIMLWATRIVGRDTTEVMIPFRGSQNPNTVGTFFTILIPQLICFALWHKTNAPITQFFLLMAPLILTLFTFSSGTYLAVACQCIFIAYFAFRDKKITQRLLIDIFIFIIICIATLFFSPNRQFIMDRICSEIHQISGIEDIQTITTHRAGIWQATIEMIKEKPILGHTAESFEANYDKNMKYFKAKNIDVDESLTFSFPHNMYLGIVYDAGIPALCLFLVFLFLSLKKAMTQLYFANISGSETKITLLVCIALICGQLLFGIGEDILQHRGEPAVIFFAFWGILVGIRRDNV